MSYFFDILHDFKLMIIWIFNDLNDHSAYKVSEIELNAKRKPPNVRNLNKFG